LKLKAAPPEGASREAITEHYELVFAEFKSLRDFVAQYSFCIPTYNL